MVNKIYKHMYNNRYKGYVLLLMWLLAVVPVRAQYLACSTDSGYAETPMLRGHFNLSHPTERVYAIVNSIGYHQLYLNGKPVGDRVMQPAVSQLDKHSLSVTYNIGPYLRDGENEIVLWLGQGWGRIYKMPAMAQAVVYRDAGYRIDTLLVTDSTWQASPSAYSYTGTFNYNGTYTSYNGPWRPTTPQPTQPTQPRPTQPTQTAAPTESETTEEESTTPSEDDFVITGGEAGAFGELIQMNGENLLIYRLPKGSFTVTNEGSEVASLSIFSNKTVTDADGKEAPAENFANYVITKDAEPVTVLMDADRYAVLNDGAVLHFVAEEEPESGTETVEPTTESLTETEATTDSASESAEASETDPAGQDPAGRPKMVLWPFILILSVLVIGLGVLIFFIIKLMKKSDGEEDAAENKRKKDQ